MTATDQHDRVDEVTQLANHLSATYRQRVDQWKVLRACAVFFATCRSTADWERELHAAVVGTRDTAAELIADMFEGLDTESVHPDPGRLCDVFWGASDEQLHALAHASPADPASMTAAARFFLGK